MFCKVTKNVIFEIDRNVLLESLVIYLLSFLQW